MNKKYRSKQAREKKNKFVLSLQSVRFFLALATILLFGMICLTALLLPEAKALKDLLPGPTSFPMDRGTVPRLTQSSKEYSTTSKGKTRVPLNRRVSQHLTSKAKVGLLEAQGGGLT